MNFVGFWVCLGVVTFRDGSDGICHVERERERDLLRLKRAIHNPQFWREISDQEYG